MWKSNIPKIKAQTRQELSALIRKATLQVEAGAKLRAPVDTGLLRNSIQSTFEGDLAGIVFVGVEYGIHVEFGTTRMRAQPFLLPALEEVVQSFGGELKTVIK